MSEGRVWSVHFSYNGACSLRGPSAQQVGLTAPVEAAQGAVPNSSGTELPKLKAPPLACDCHHTTSTIRLASSLLKRWEPLATQQSPITAYFGVGSARPEA